MKIEIIKSLKEQIVDYVFSDQVELSQEVRNRLSELSTLENHKLYHEVLDVLQSDRNHWNMNYPTPREMKYIVKINRVFHNY